MNTKIKHYIESLSEPKKFNRIILGVGIIAGAFVIFEAGMFVGFHKASFNRNWGENYSRNFGPMNRGKLQESMPENFPNAHGAIGKIIKIESSTLIIEDKDGTEKVILVTDDTQIRHMREKVARDGLKVDSFVVVIGTPNDAGQIEAKLIRILPDPASVVPFIQPNFID